jgi:hypothetical protein
MSDLTFDWFEHINKHPFAHQLWLKVLGSWAHPVRREKFGLKNGDAMRDMPLPQAGVCDVVSDGDGLGCSFVWDSKTHHLKIEIRDDQQGSFPIEWFYLNRETGAADSCNDETEYSIPFKVFDYLDLIDLENAATKIADIAKKAEPNAPQSPFHHRSLLRRFLDWMRC